MYLSMVVPCLNEERGLQRLHTALVGALAGHVRDYEVILVDDGSTDATLAEARRLAAADPRVRYVSLSRNFGKEAAMLCGLRHARGERVAVLDADLQHPPEMLRQMLALLEAGYDQVVACRSRTGEYRWRRALSTLYYRMAQRLLDVPVPDGAGDFRVLSRRAVEALLSLPEQHRFSKGLFSWIGFATAYLPVTEEPRAERASRWGIGALLEHAIDGVTAFNPRPLRSAFPMGLALIVLALGCGTHALWQSVWHEVPGLVVLLAVSLGLGGVQLCGLGVLGAYVGRGYAEVKRRPHYLVKESSPVPACEPRLRAARPVA